MLIALVILLNSMGPELPKLGSASAGELVTCFSAPLIGLIVQARTLLGSLFVFEYLVLYSSLPCHTLCLIFYLSQLAHQPIIYLP